MNDDENVSVEHENDALADAAKAGDFQSGECIGGGLDRAKDERIREAHPLKCLTDNALRQCIDIDNNVGKFRQASLIIRCMRTALSFLIGCVFGATGVLMWVHETSASPKGLAARSAASSKPEAPRSGGGASSAVRPIAHVMGTNLLVPVEGVLPTDLRRDFDDPRGGGRTHGALDIRAPRGTPVVAVANGTIKKLFTSKAGGLTIYQYDEGEELCYYYAHLDRYADGIREGMPVARGDVIGFVGVSGNAPIDAPHLHFGVTKLLPTKEWWKGEAIDPYPLLTGR